MINARIISPAVIIEGDRAGIAYAEISTGEFATTQITDGGGILNLVRQELARLQPREILIPRQGSWKERDAGQSDNRPEAALSEMGEMNFTTWASHRFEETTARQELMEHFGVRTLQGFGCEGKPLAIRAAGAALSYLKDTQQGLLPQIIGLRTYATDRFMAMDPSTWRNLEITETLRRERRGSLLGVIDETTTAMGGRLLLTRLAQPLLDIDVLGDTVGSGAGFCRGWYSARTNPCSAAPCAGSGTDDQPGFGRPCFTPRFGGHPHGIGDCAGIRASAGRRVLVWTTLLAGLTPVSEVATLIATAIVDDPPAQLSAGGLIRPGFSAELDGIILASKGAREWIAGLQENERERTGIKTLKVGYNKVFGYYLEVTKANVNLVPEHYIRKQTLVNSERYITPELKEYESLVLNAQERISELESRLFREINQRIAVHAAALLATAQALAHIDVAASLADVAVRYQYTRPTFDEMPSYEYSGWTPSGGRKNPA